MGIVVVTFWSQGEYVKNKISKKKKKEQNFIDNKW